MSDKPMPAVSALRSTVAREAQRDPEGTLTVTDGLDRLIADLMGMPTVPTMCCGARMRLTRWTRRCTGCGHRRDVHGGWENIRETRWLAITRPWVLVTEPLGRLAAIRDGQIGHAE